MRVSSRQWAFLGTPVTGGSLMRAFIGVGGGQRGIIVLEIFAKENVFL